MDEQALETLDAPATGEAPADAALEAALARATEMEARWRASALHGAAALALQARGCRDVEAGLLLLDRAGLAVADDGAVAGIAEAVTALQAARPYLFAPRTSGGAVNPAAAAPPPDPAGAFARWLKGEA